MSYTSDDLAAIDRAIVEFGKGDRVGSVTCDGEKIEYSETSLTELRQLRAEIARSLKPKAKTRFRPLFYSKGL